MSDAYAIAIPDSQEPALREDGTLTENWYYTFYALAQKVGIDGSVITNSFIDTTTPSAGDILVGSGGSYANGSIGAGSSKITITVNSTTIEVDADESAFSLANLSGVLGIGQLDVENGTAETTVDGTNDKLVMYDASADANRAVSVENIVNAVATTVDLTGALRRIWFLGG